MAIATKRMCGDIGALRFAIENLFTTHVTVILFGGLAAEDQDGGGVGDISDRKVGHAMCTECMPLVLCPDDRFSDGWPPSHCAGGATSPTWLGRRLGRVRGLLKAGGVQT